MAGISGQNFGVPSPLPLLGITPYELMRAGTLLSDHSQDLDPGTEVDLNFEYSGVLRQNRMRVVVSTAAIAFDPGAANTSQRIVSADLSTAAKHNYSDAKIAAYAKGSAEPAGVMIPAYAYLGALQLTTVAGDRFMVICKGIAQVRSGGALLVGDTFKSNGSGKAVATAAGDRSCGYALTAAAGADVIFWAMVDCTGNAIA